jgi:hypothetical protein
MTEEGIRTSRLRALENQIKRLERRVDHLGDLSRRYSWYRLGVILLGGLFTWAASTQLNVVWGRGMFVIALVAFAWVAANHRRLDEWIEKFIIWMEIKSDQLARMTLNWSSIPEPTLPDPPSKKPLEIDLDITGPHSLHQLIDIAVSREGSQLLAKWLSQEVPNLNLIREHQRVVRELTPLTRFRERLLLTFRLISREPMEGGKLLGWLKEEIPSQKLKWLLPIAAILVATNITLFLLNSFGRLPAYWIISLSIYLGFY